MAVASTEKKAKTVEEIDVETSSDGKKATVPKAPKGPKAAPKKKKPKEPKKKDPGAKGKTRGEAVDEPDAPEKRAHPARTSFLAASIFWLVLVAALVSLTRLGKYDESGEYKFLFDPEGVIRGPILLFLNPNELTPEEYFSADYDGFRDWEIELGERDDAITAKEDELDLRESELDDRESELDDKQTQIDDILENINSSGTQGGTISYDISTVVKMLEGMTSSNAATMLSQMDEESAVNILVKMKAKNASAVMDAMTAIDASLAGSLTEQWYEKMKPPDLG